MFMYDRALSEQTSAVDSLSTNQLKQGIHASLFSPSINQHLNRQWCRSTIPHMHFLGRSLAYSLPPGAYLLAPNHIASISIICSAQPSLYSPKQLSKYSPSFKFHYFLSFEMELSSILVISEISLCDMSCGKAKKNKNTISPGVQLFTSLNQSLKSYFSLQHLSVLELTPCILI